MGVSWRVMPMRAGQIGPIRREIIFEPVHEEPLPVIPVPEPATPATPSSPKEPAPQPA